MNRYTEMRRILFSAVVLAVGAMASSAATFTFNTSPGALNSSNEAVDAEAVITTGAGVINVQLFDLQGDPNDVSQLLSGFTFTLNQSASVTGSVVPTAPNGLVDVTGNGVATPTTGTITSWDLSSTSNSVSSAIRVNSLVGGPSETVIGPTNSSFTPNGSLTNGPHNPFINEEADFSIAISGVTSNTSILGVSFGFGTNGDLPYLAGDPTPQTTATPEPATIVMTLSGLALAAIGVSRRKKKVA